jgi:hypothetical protein
MAMAVFPEFPLRVQKWARYNRMSVSSKEGLGITLAEVSLSESVGAEEARPEDDSEQNHDSAQRIFSILGAVDSDIDKLSQTNSIFKTMSNFLDALSGGVIPSSNDQIGGMKANMNIGYGAEKNNEIAESHFARYLKDLKFSMKNIEKLIFHLRNSSVNGEFEFSEKLPDRVVELKNMYSIRDRKSGSSTIYSDKNLYSTQGIVSSAISLIESDKKAVIDVYRAYQKYIGELPNQILLGGRVDSGVREAVQMFVSASQKLIRYPSVFDGMADHSGRSDASGQSGESEGYGEQVDSIFSVNKGKSGDPLLSNLTDTSEQASADYSDLIITLNGINTSISESISEDELGLNYQVKNNDSERLIVNVIVSTNKVASESLLLHLNRNSRSIFNDLIESRYISFKNSYLKDDILGYINDLSFIIDDGNINLSIVIDGSITEGMVSGDNLLFIHNTSSDTNFKLSIAGNYNYNIIKAGEAQTTPYYETISPDGEKVYFTPADLVSGGGKLKSPKGKSFKPKKIKGKSLADRVNSKGFGKVRKR